MTPNPEQPADLIEALKERFDATEELTDRARLRALADGHDAIHDEGECETCDLARAAARVLRWLESEDA